MVTEVVHQPWFSRLGKSIVGVLFGFLFFIGAIILLGWNEGRAIKTETGLKEGAARVVSLDTSTPDTGHDEHLVHVTQKDRPAFAGRLVFLFRIGDLPP